MGPTEIAVFLVGAPLSGLLAYLGIRRGARNDKAAQEVAAAANVYAGYGGLMERYEKDNLDLRNRLAVAEQAAAEVPHLKHRLEIAEQHLADALQRLSDAERRIVMMLDKLGERPGS